MRVDPLLLWMLTNELDCSTTQVVANFNSYYKQCIECPPNIKRKFGNKLSFKCWVLRGFYPKTDIMFKMMIGHSDGERVFVKVSLPSPKITSKMPIFTEHNINSTLNNILLDNIQQEKKPIAPRCMTPRGMKPLNRSKV